MSNHTGDDSYDGRYNNLDHQQNPPKDDDYKIRPNGFASVPSYYKSLIGTNELLYLSIHKLMNDYNAYRKLDDSPTPMNLIQFYFKSRPLSLPPTQVIKLSMLEDYKTTLEALIRLELGHTNHKF